MEQKFDSKETPNKYQQAFLESKVETNDAVVAAEVEKSSKSISQKMITRKCINSCSTVWT